MPRNIIKNCHKCNQEFLASFHTRKYCSLDCKVNSFFKEGDPNECWLWTGPKDPDGYGLVQNIIQNEDKKRKVIKVHRYIYERYKGKIPKNLLICHTCDNPTCINPNHLWAGTVQENTIDMIKKGRNPDIKGDKNPMSRKRRAAREAAKKSF